MKETVFSAVWALLWCGIFAFSMHRDRSRYRNIILLLLAAGSVFVLLLSIFGQAVGIVMMVLAFLFLLAFLILPTFLIPNGFVMMRKEGKSLANLLSLLLGLVLLAGEVALVMWFTGIYSDRMNVLANLSPFLLFLIVTWIYVSLTFLSFLFYCLFLQIIPVKRDFDYVIIHGSGIRNDGTVTKLLADRCDKAIEIYRRDPTPPYLIPSGGQGKDEVCSEAEAMKRYLLEKGIPADHILMEDQSTTTMENIRNSKAIIDAREGRKYTALVTSNYHVYRAMRYARTARLKAVGIGSRTASYYFPSALIREFIAVHREKKHLIIYLLGYLLMLVPVLLIAITGS